MSSKKLDRTMPPEVRPFNKIPFPKIEKTTLDNGISVYWIPFGQQEVFECRLVTRGGKSFEPAHGVSGFSAKMLREGTEMRSGFEFAKKLDEFGAFVSSDSGFESATFGLTSLSRFAGDTLPLLREMVLSPAFEETEFDKLIRRTLESLQVEDKKTRHQARKLFSRLLFGESHPYRGSSEPDEIESIKLEDVRCFHRTANSLANAFFVISGKFDQKKISGLLNQEFGSTDLIDNTCYISPEKSQSIHLETSAGKGFHLFEMTDSLQATLRVGQLAFDMKHPDYHKMQVASTILGGYFGSRLMKNIREDKGFTYGIHASWVGMKHHGFFVIQTDVDNKNIDATLKEIRFELNRFLEEGVGQKELDLVRNYLMGRSVSNRETPAQIVDAVSSALINEIGFEKLDEAFDVVREITPAEVERVSRAYFKPENLLEVVAGKR